MLYQSAYDRTEQMRRELPDALDLLTISVEAGLAFDAGLSQVARNTTGPLAEEFFRVLQEMQIGIGRDRGACARSATAPTCPSCARSSPRWCRPTPSASRSPTCCACRPGRCGSSARQRAEELAQKVPVKILFPLIFCIFPTLFVVILGPAIVTIAKTLFGIGG